MYRLVALDLDGTLLNKEKQVSVANIAALTRLHDLGVGLALCTGRAAPSAQRIQQLVNLPLDTICYNGAVVLADQSKIPILQLVIHQEITAKMLEFVEMQGLCMNLYIGQEMYLVHCRNDKHREFARKYESLTGIRYTKLLNRAEGIDDNARSHKLLIFTEQVEQTYQMVLQVCGEKAHVVKEKFFVEVLGINAHKGRGLEELCAFYGIQLSEAIAMGDGENDCQVLNCAGLGIAMANAEESAKRAASKVSKWSHDEDAVANEINELLKSGKFAPLKN